MYISHSSKIPDQMRVELKWEEEYSKICLKQPLKKKIKNWFQDQLLLNVGQKYCRMLQGEHSAILLTFINIIKLSYHLLIRPLICRFLSGRLRQALV